jgi:lycopene cyclase domain-containing protein
MAHYTYLLLNFFTILIPFSLSFETKVSFYKKWRYYLPSLLITATIFLIWDYFKTKNGVWQFNDAYIIGIKFFGLPLEEYFFFITVPYACSFIYEVLAYYIKKDLTHISTKSVLLAISFIFLITSFFVLPRAYTWSVFFGMSCIIPFLVYALSNLKIQHFLLMFLISLFPMAIVNGVLTALPVVIYNNAQNTSIRTFTIPIEDYLYSFIMLGLNIGLYEWFKTLKLRSNVSLNQSPINA